MSSPKATTNPTPLELCIGPLPEDEFFRAHWEQQPLVCVRENDRGRFSDLISVRDFDRIVSCGNLRYPFFRLFKGGNLIPIENCTTQRQVGSDVDRDLADLNVVYDQYSSGATIVLQVLERSWPPLVALCRDLEVQFGCPVQAYAYLSPASAQGPPAHYDTHDVFVLQVGGRKKWKVWGNPRPLPLRKSSDSYDPDLVGAEVRAKAPLYEVTLEPGDSIYLPRGFIHEAVTTDCSSLHISIGVMVNRWLDVMIELTENALAKCRQDLPFRKAIPAGRYPGQPPDEEAGRYFEGLKSEFLKSFDLRRGLEMVRHEFVSSRTPSNRGRLLDLEQLDTVNEETRVFRRRDIISRVEKTAEAVTLSLNGGGEEQFDARFGPAVDFTTGADAFRVSELPGDLGGGEKIDFAKRLIGAGYLTLQPGLA